MLVSGLPDWPGESSPSWLPPTAEGGGGDSGQGSSSSSLSNLFSNLLGRKIKTEGRGVVPGGSRRASSSSNGGALGQGGVDVGDRRGYYVGRERAREASTTVFHGRRRGRSEGSDGESEGGGALSLVALEVSLGERGG